MSVPVMMFGGHRDGEVLEVPGNVVPDTNKIIMTLKPLPVTLDSPTDFGSYLLPKRTIVLDIVPRKARTGPAWKIELPKELW